MGGGGGFGRVPVSDPAGAIAVAFAATAGELTAGVTIASAAAVAAVAEAKSGTGTGAATAATGTVLATAATEDAETLDTRRPSGGGGFGRDTTSSTRNRDASSMRNRPTLLLLRPSSAPATEADTTGTGATGELPAAELSAGAGCASAEEAVVASSAAARWEGGRRTGACGRLNVAGNGSDADPGAVEFALALVSADNAMA